MLLKNKLSSRRLFFGGRILTDYSVRLKALFYSPSFSPFRLIFLIPSSPLPFLASHPPHPPKLLRASLQVSLHFCQFPLHPSPSSAHKDMPLRAANT